MKILRIEILMDQFVAPGSGRTWVASLGLVTVAVQRILLSVVRRLRVRARARAIALCDGEIYQQYKEHAVDATKNYYC